MKLNTHQPNRTRRGSLMLAVAIVSLVYYSIVILKELRDNRRRPAPQSAAEYYNQAAGTLPSQFGRRSSSSCGSGGCVTVDSDGGNSGDGGTLSTGPGASNSQETWTTYTDGWVYRRGNEELGRIYRDGTTKGFVSAQPNWYPSGMPQAFQRVQTGQLPGRTTTGDLPPDGQPYAGQSGQSQSGQPLPPTGVDKSKVAEDKAKIPSGVSINGQPASEALVRDRLSDSAKSQGLKDYENSLRLVVVGHNDNERKAFISIAKPLADASEGKLIIQEYDDNDWQIKAHANAAKNVPEYETGKPFAYLQRSTGAVKAIMFTPSEVAQVIKQHRPEVAPNFDANRARAITQASDSWMLWASAAFVAVCGLIGAVTSKSQ